jgi:hypothetical protein
VTEHERVIETTYFAVFWSEFFIPLDNELREESSGRGKTLNMYDIRWSLENLLILGAKAFSLLFFSLPLDLLFELIDFSSVLLYVRQNTNPNLFSAKSPPIYK